MGVKFGRSRWLMVFKLVGRAFSGGSEGAAATTQHLIAPVLWTGRLEDRRSRICPSTALLPPLEI